MPVFPLKHQLLHLFVDFIELLFLLWLVEKLKIALHDFVFFLFLEICSLHCYAQKQKKG
jgi:hypothetical protein